MKTPYPHVQSAMVNAMREEATREELADKVQELFNEVCFLKKTSRETAVAEHRTDEPHIA